MCSAGLLTIFAAGTAGGASGLLWRRRQRAKPPSLPPEPPSATFKEWIAAIESRGDRT